MILKVRKGLRAALRCAAATAVMSALASCEVAEPPARTKAPAANTVQAGEAPASGREVGRPGGRLVVALTSDPRTFNPLVAASGATLRVLDFMHDDLLGFDPQSQTVRPVLARDWRPVETHEPDTWRYRLTLRQNLRFSDGEPMDADDVVFTVRRVLDERTGSPQAETLKVAGRAMEVRALDRHTLEVDMAAPVADAGLLFDRLYILPEHLLANVEEPAAAWGVDTPPEQMAGLGPFRLVEYLPGERLRFERNPHFVGRDAEGGRLPYLDELVVLIVPDRQAALLRFEAGEINLLDSVPNDGFDRLRAAGRADLGLSDLGAGTAYEILFFNLNTDVPAPVAAKQPWFREPAFRRALSLALDRRGVADLVYGGHATPIITHVSPSNTRWWLPIEPPPVSLDDAEAMLREAGFTWAGEGPAEERRLRDPNGDPVALTLVTNSTNARRSQTATVVAEDWKRLGIDIRVVTLEFGALLDRVGNTFDYEVGLLGLGRGGIDPNSDLNVWHSSGSNHLWHLGADSPTTPWQRKIDELMERQKSELDPAARKALYHQVQALVAEHLPVIPVVAPNVLVAADSELGNVAPTIFEPSLLWNVERLYWRSPGP